MIVSLLSLVLSVFGPGIADACLVNDKAKADIISRETKVKSAAGMCVTWVSCSKAVITVYESDHASASHYVSRSSKECL